MRLFWSFLVVPCATLVVGCDSCNSGSSSGAVASSVPSTPSGSASTAPAPSGSVAASGKMAHCPDAVPGAKTAIQDVAGGVTLSITAADPASVADIRARTQALLEAQKNQSSSIRHTGTGEGGGLLGRCPVVLKETTVVASDIDTGTKVTVTSKDPAEVDWLRRETRDREEDLEAAGSPAGSGKMSHCPSAVNGAITTLKNTPDGVTVVVTVAADAGAADAVTAIRDRSKHLAEVANSPDAGPADGSHTGAGGGGGGIGRCPIVVKDTTLKVKDVPGGSQVDVKARKVAAVPALQAEAKERAAKFQLPPMASASATAPRGSSVPAPAPSH